MTKSLGTASTLSSFSILIQSLNEKSIVLGLTDWIETNDFDNNSKINEYWTSNSLFWVDLL